MMEHSDDRHFVINIHALHNATLIWKIIPPRLTLPACIYPDCQAHYFKLAAKLRVSQAEKREATKAKRAATKNTNLAKKAAQQVVRRGGVLNTQTDDE